jgi:hypothetical protein
MRTGTSFARDWQLIKVARSLRRHDVAGPLVKRLLADASPGLTERITVIAGRLGEENGTALLAHTEERFDSPTLMEGLLLTWGIPASPRTPTTGAWLSPSAATAQQRRSGRPSQTSGWPGLTSPVTPGRSSGTRCSSPAPAAV